MTRIIGILGGLLIVGPCLGQDKQAPPREMSPEELKLMLAKPPSFSVPAKPAATANGPHAVQGRTPTKESLVDHALADLRAKQAVVLARQAEFAFLNAIEASKPNEPLRERHAQLDIHITEANAMHELAAARLRLALLAQPNDPAAKQKTAEDALVEARIAKFKLMAIREEELVLKHALKSSEPVKDEGKPNEPLRGQHPKLSEAAIMMLEIKARREVEVALEREAMRARPNEPLRGQQGKMADEELAIRLSQIRADEAAEEAARMLREIELRKAFKVTVNNAAQQEQVKAARFLAAMRLAEAQARLDAQIALMEAANKLSKMSKNIAPNANNPPEQQKKKLVLSQISDGTSLGAMLVSKQDNALIVTSEDHANLARRMETLQIQAIQESVRAILSTRGEEAEALRFLDKMVDLLKRKRDRISKEHREKQEKGALVDLEETQDELGMTHLKIGLISQVLQGRREVSRLEAEMRAGRAGQLELERAREQVRGSEKRLAEVREK